MGSLSFGYSVVVLLVLLLLFGWARISETMEDIGKGIHSFRKGLMGHSDDHVIAPAQNIESLRLACSKPEGAARQPE